NAKNGIVFDGIEGAQHEVLAVLERSIGGLLGSGVARYGGKAIVEFPAEGAHHHDADEGSGHEQVKALSPNGEEVEGDTAGDDEIDETSPGCGHKNGDQHDQHSEKPSHFDHSIPGGDHEGGRKRQREHDGECEIVRVPINATQHTVEAGYVVAYDERSGTSDGHRQCLDKNDSPQAVEGGDEEEDQHPGDVDFGKIDGARNGAASPDRRQERADKQIPDHDQEQGCLLGQILECAFGSTQAVEQAPHGQDGGDLGEGEKLQTGNPVFRAGAI